MKIKTLLIPFLVLTTAACTHTPSAGEKMLTHSEEARKLGKQWTKGEESILESKDLEKKGDKLIRSGNKKIAKGKKLISEGESDVNKGNKALSLSNSRLKDGRSLQQESESEIY